MNQPTGRASITRIHISEQETRVAAETGSATAMTFALSVGVLRLGPGPFHHEPPSPLELENAIAAVEDAVMPLAKLVPTSTALATGDAGAVRMARFARPGLAAFPAVLSLDEVERQFDDVAAISLGRPAVSAGLPTDGAFVAYVLILREFMHHVGFQSVTIDPSAEHEDYSAVP